MSNTDKAKQFLERAEQQKRAWAILHKACNVPNDISVIIVSPQQAIKAIELAMEDARKQAIDEMFEKIGNFLRSLREEPKIEVYSQSECIFNYCPHPEICKEKGCQNPSPPKQDKP